MSVTIDLSGQTALVTGASQGIGAAIATALHRAGANVIINHPDLGTTRSDAERLVESLRSIRSGSAHAEAADVSDPVAVQSMMKRIKDQYGGLDLLVNNAGILRDRTIGKMTVDEWRAVIDVNLSGVFFGCKYALEVFRDGGAIVNISSLSAETGFFGQSNYAAAKAGVSALTRVLSKECARRGIRVNAIAPGLVQTAMADTLAENVRAEMLKIIPLRRLCEPEEIANVVLFLCSPLSSYITGHTLSVNGGWRG